MDSCCVKHSGGTLTGRFRFMTILTSAGTQPPTLPVLEGRCIRLEKWRHGHLPLPLRESWDMSNWSKAGKRRGGVRRTVTTRDRRDVNHVIYPRGGQVLVQEEERRVDMVLYEMCGGWQAD